jgi:5-oxoprolinase (ATP-hydrolysing) subunit A
MPLITSANIACGAHAGSLETMIETVELATAHGIAIGAHPGYFDLEDFGRKERNIEPMEAGRIVLLQIEQMFQIAGGRLRHVKLHGALYHQVGHDPLLAEAVASDLARLWPDLVVFGPSGSEFVRAARAVGLTVAEEGFADRTYQADGKLTPRSRPDAVVQDEAAAVAQVMRMVNEHRIRTIEGTDIEMKADTICLHGDGPRPVALARRLRQDLSAAGIEVRRFQA